MRIRLSEIRWGRGVLTGMGVSLISLLAVIVTVFIYGFVLGFQARGAPDPVRVARFADQFAPWLGPGLTFLLTIGAGALVARKAPGAALPNAVFTGLVVATINLSMVLFGTGTFNLLVIAWFFLTLAAGGFGGFLVTLVHPAPASA